MDCAVYGSAAGAVAKGLVTVLIVGGLLSLAHRRGRSVAGLLAGLPTVTGPALLWLALDRGVGFAAEATVGAAAAGACCALFALGYGRVGRHFGPLGGLIAGTAASTLPLPWLVSTAPSLSTWFVLATATCALSHRWLVREAAAVAQTEKRPPGTSPTRGWLITAVISGLVSALASALAGSLGPLWAGVLTSPPLLAAAVALELHRQAGRIEPVVPFLSGYVAGLVGRGLFAAVLGVLIEPVGTAAAFTVALAASLLAGRWPFGDAAAGARRRMQPGI